MPIERTIVINCAGMGNRLGLGVTKALVSVEGKPLIIRHLEMLSGEKDVRVVIGYQAEKVIGLVKQFRSDVVFVLNHQYKTTNSGASLALAARYANEYVLSIHGDLLIHPDDMKKLLACDHEFLSGGEIVSDDPWRMQVDERENSLYVQGIHKSIGQYEWNGIVQIHRDKIRESTGHVSQVVAPCLPMPFLPVKTREIDTMNDYERACKWVKNGFS